MGNFEVPSLDQVASNICLQSHFHQSLKTPSFRWLALKNSNNEFFQTWRPPLAPNVLRFFLGMIHTLEHSWAFCQVYGLNSPGKSTVSSTVSPQCSLPSTPFAAAAANHIRFDVGTLRLACPVNVGPFNRHFSHHPILKDELQFHWAWHHISMSIGIL